MFSILMSSEQRVIVKFLFNDGLDGHQITEELGLQFHEDGCSIHTVRFWIGEVQRPEKIEMTRLDGKAAGRIYRSHKSAIMR
jgi:hypothetical protein